MAIPTRAATTGSRSTPRNTATPGGDTPKPKGGKGQLLRYSSFYPGVKEQRRSLLSLAISWSLDSARGLRTPQMSGSKKPSLLLTGNQMKTGGHVSKTSKVKKKETSLEFGHIPKPNTKNKRTVPADVKERQAKFDAMIEGELTDLPPLPKSAVRIFLSSTFSDMREERNTLARMVYPVLKDYCASLDLDFQVVDMRWGITEDSQNDHSVEDLCLREIVNCRNVSLGPNFVCILGDRYGFQLIPSKIESSEFDKILEETASRDKDDAGILTTWYLKDENAVPHQHILQPVRTFHPHFGVHMPGSEEASAADSASWSNTLAKIRQILRLAASRLRQKGQMTQERFQQFHWSVTECEITSAVLNAKECKDHALFFHRELVGLPDSCADDEAWKYVDLSESKEEVDSEARRKLASLSTDVLTNTLGKDQCFYFRIPWRSGGINPSKSSEHSSYIFEFCKTFIINVTQLIEKAHDKRHSFIKQSEYYSEPGEIIHHLQFCVDKFKTFCGRDDILHTAKQYILDQSIRTPLVIHAESGAGKTSIMAAIMKNISYWFGKPFIGVVRFLGTSPQTINIYDVLFSICGQLADATDLIMEPVGYHDFSSLIQYMPRFLRRVASAAKVPIVILLDSIDQLSSANSAYFMKWLPLTLPGNVKLILSTLPKENDILTNIRRRLTNATCFVEVPILPEKTVHEIVTKYLSAKHRSLTIDQSMVITAKFQQDPSPLYLKLLLDNGVTWHSYTTLPQMRVGESARQAIHLLFSGLEQKYGQELIQAALGFITVSLNGITEIELEDVLSCDNVVLDSVYQFHDPPVEGIVRIPPLLWARIYHDLKEYLVERLSQGKTTLNWYHRQFIQVARERFLIGRQEQLFHKKLLEIFMAESGIQKDITLSRRQKTILQADRQVTHQPMTIKNKRKLECITHHLISANSEVSIDEAKEKVFCNYDFLATKICAFSVRHVIDEMDRLLENTLDSEISKIRNFMKNTFADLRYPMQLAVHLLAGVSNTEGCPYLEQLLQQAKTRIYSHPSPVLIPEGPCLVPRERSESSLLSCIVGCKQIVSCTDKYILTKEEGIEESNSVFGVFDIVSGEHKVLQHIKFNDYLVEPLLIEDDIYLICETSMSIYNLSTGTLTESQIDIMVKQDETIKMCVHSKDGALFAALSSVGNLHVWDMREGKCVCQIPLSNWTRVSYIFRHDSESYLIVGEFVSDEQEQSGSILEFNQADRESNNVHTSCTLSDGKVFIISGTSYLVAASDFTETGTDIYVLSLAPITLINTIRCSYRINQIQGFVTRLGPAVCIISDTGKVILYSVDNGRQTLQFELEDSYACCALSEVLQIQTIECLALGRDNGSISFHDFESGKQIGQMKAFETPLKGLLMKNKRLIGFGQSTQIKLWDFNKLVNEGGILFTINETARRSLYEEALSTNIELSLCNRYVYTCTKTQIICVWDVQTGTLKTSYDCGLMLTDLQAARGQQEVLVVFSKISQSINILCGSSGEEIIDNMPHNVLSTVLTRDKSTLYVITDVEGRLKLYEYELNRARLSRSFFLQKGLSFRSVKALLSHTERYLIIQVELTPEDKKAIESQWKRGGFAPQPHPFRFSAIDLTHTSGTLLHCYRQLSKIPALGSVMIAHTGNTMIFCVRRCVCFWDIPTGRCDQMITKSGRHGMFYNPSWLGGSDGDVTTFVSCIVEADDKTVVVMGSDDGYATTYRADSGAPVGMKAPLTKHNAPVHIVTITGDGKCIFSACQKNVLKMWDPQTASELFSLRLDGKIRSIKISPDSRHLVVLTGTLVTRVLVFLIYPGKNELKKVKEI